MAKMKPKIIIGIDPGIHTGVAVWDKTAKVFTSLGTHGFWQAHEVINGHLSECDMIIPVAAIGLMMLPVKQKHYGTFQCVN